MASSSRASATIATSATSKNIATSATSETSVENMDTEHHIVGETEINEMATEMTTIITENPLQRRMKQLWKERKKGGLLLGK